MDDRDLAKDKRIKILITGIILLFTALLIATAVLILRFSLDETDSISSDAAHDPSPGTMLSAPPDAPVSPGLSQPSTQPSSQPETAVPPPPSPVPPEITAPPLQPSSAPPGPIYEMPPPPEPVPEATDITDSLTVRLSDGRRSASLLDRNYSTRLVFNSEAIVEISSTEDIHALYVIWALPPGEWELTGSDTQACGRDGFIHEFIALDHPTSELQMHLPQTGSTLSDIYAFTRGTPPDWVQVWRPPLWVADLLVLPTHADDEHLFFVGVLPYYAAERGYGVQVAYLTHHWNQPPRPHELLNGLWEVGIRNYPVISDFRDRLANSLDHAISIYGWDNVVGFHVEMLRRFQPLVVVGHDLNGEYGHGVHMLNARTLIEAVELAADEGYHPASFERYGTWDTPKLYLHLYRQNSITMDWGVPLDAFGGATARDMAVAGYNHHISQHRWAFRVPATGPRGHVFGLARSLVGRDVRGGDMFENISRSRFPVEEGIMSFD